jgi:hypothetical protein
MRETNSLAFLWDWGTEFGFLFNNLPTSGFLRRDGPRVRIDCNDLAVSNERASGQITLTLTVPAATKAVVKPPVTRALGSGQWHVALVGQVRRPSTRCYLANWLALDESCLLVTFRF